MKRRKPVVNSDGLQYNRRELTNGGVAMNASVPLNVGQECLARILRGEPLFDKKQGIVAVSERDYEEMAKARRNAEYLRRLDESLAQLERGETISFSMEELRAMEADDWAPTQKVLEFERAHGIVPPGSAYHE